MARDLDSSSLARARTISALPRPRSCQALGPTRLDRLTVARSSAIASPLDRISISLEPWLPRPSLGTHDDGLTSVQSQQAAAQGGRRLREVSDRMYEPRSDRAETRARGSLSSRSMATCTERVDRSLADPAAPTSSQRSSDPRGRRTRAESSRSASRSRRRTVRWLALSCADQAAFVPLKFAQCTADVS